MTDYLVEYMHPAQIDDVLMREAIAGLPPAISHATDVRVVVSGNVSRSIREREDPKRAEFFSKERITGRVGGKTLRSGDGGYDIVIEGGLVHRQNPIAKVNVRRLLEHEGWHVVLGQREENTEAVFKRIRPDAHERLLLGTAALSVEEYRIERQLWGEGHQEEHSRAEDLVGILADLRTMLSSAVIVQFEGETIERTYNEVAQAFDQVTKHMAYVAAEPAEFRQHGLESVMETGGWDRLIGDVWPEMEGGLSRFTPALGPMEFSVLDERIQEMAAIHRRWLERIGFAIELDNGGEYFRVLLTDF